MLLIKKLDETDPDHGTTIKWLAERQAAYKKTFVNGSHNPQPGKKQERYLHDYGSDKVKAALRKETRDKCAYCEWKYNPGAWGDVEHILPKANDWVTRLLDYGNLTLACSVCNVAKSNYENVAEPLLNPYAADPRNHLQAVGSLLAERTPSGTIAIEILKLNRENLVAAREETVRRCREKLSRYTNATNPAIKQALLEEIIEDHDSDREFAMVRRAFYAFMLREVCQWITPENRAEP